MPQQRISAAEQLFEDLQWTVESPSLLDFESSELSKPSVEFTDVKLGDLRTAAPSTVESNRAAELLQFVDPCPRRVGHYMEALVHFQLAHVMQRKIFARQQQIFEGKQTLGELDFVYESDQGEAVHLEVAVKFFLYLPGRVGFPCPFIGPNSIDNFTRKTQRMLTHQLPLSDRWVGKVDRKEMLVKGRIFTNPTVGNPMETPVTLAADCLTGTWLWAHQLDWFRDWPSDHRFVVLSKPHWLSDVRLRAMGSKTSQAAECVTSDELCGLLQIHFSRQAPTATANCIRTKYTSHDRPLMISVLMPIADGGMRECQRCFVVSDRWPNDRAGLPN